MQYPEHTIESYKAAALMGAGIIECDVTFTKDRELICEDPRILRMNFIHGDFRISHIESTLTLSTVNAQTKVVTHNATCTQRPTSFFILK